MLVLNLSSPDTELMEDSELLRTLAAMENFAATFPVVEEGKNLSQAARDSAD